MNTNHAETKSNALPIGCHYEVEGLQLLLHRSGTGGPAVIILPGAGFIGLDYWNVHEELSKRTTCVIYDRAGTGWSDHIQLPRTAEEVVRELRRLLQAANIPAPYILVGHSLGGIYARRYAQCYPDEVAGILMLDPVHEGFLHAPKVRTRDIPRQIWNTISMLLNKNRVYRNLFEQALRNWPSSLHDQLVDYHLRNLRNTKREGKNLSSQLFPEIMHGGSIPDVPLVILSSMEIDPMQAVILPETYLRRINDFKYRLYSVFAKSVPHGENRAIQHAGHSWLHIDRTDAVLQSVDDIIKTLGNRSGM